MNAKQLVKALKPLEGYRLYPDERQQDDQGNVILYNGLIDRDGAPSGLTIRASDVQEVTWITLTTVRLIGKSGRTVTITIQHELLAEDNRHRRLGREMARIVAS